MFRVLAPLLIAVMLLTGGCASDLPAQRSFSSPPRTITKTVIVEKRRTCTVTVRPLTKLEFCSRGPRACSDRSMTCGEAYYRYTTCGEDARDGGVAGDRNGIPCQVICGNTALQMATRIKAEEPFSPPTQTTTVCDPV